MAPKLYDIETWGEVVELIRVEDKDAVRIYALDWEGNRVARFNSMRLGISSWDALKRLKTIPPTADFKTVVTVNGGKIIVPKQPRTTKAEKKAKLEARLVEISRECVGASLEALPACAESAWNESRNAIEIGVDRAIAFTVAEMSK